MERVYLKYHHMGPLDIVLGTVLGEGATFDCPHCHKQVALIANSLEDGDTIILSFGRDMEELEKELENELESNSTDSES